MYFYNHKIDKNEKAKLLEMRCNACINLGHGSRFFIVKTNSLIIKGCGF